MSFGFGVGDFMKAVSLAVNIATALSESKGACVDYQNFILELDNTATCLHFIHDILGETKLQQSSLNALTKEGYECHKVLKELLSIVDKYKAKLGAERKVKQGMKVVWVTSWQKVGWSLFQQEEVTKLRAKLGRHVANMMLVLQGCGVNALSRVEKSSGAVHKTQQDIEKQVKENLLAVSRIENEINDQSQLQAYHHKQISGVEAELDKNTAMLNRIERIVMARSNLTHNLDTDIAPVKFNDALDRQVVLPYELCLDWQKLHDTIGIMFRGHPAFLRVSNQYFALTDESNNSALILPEEVSTKVKPGMKLAMSMILEKKGCINDPEVQKCPRCQSKFQGAKVQLQKTIRCNVCAAWIHVTTSSSNQINTLRQFGNKATYPDSDIRFFQRIFLILN